MYNPKRFNSGSIPEWEQLTRCITNKLMRMTKIKFHNYNTVVDFGNGKSASFKTQQLSGIFEHAKQLARDNKTTFLQAKIYPLSVHGKIVVFKDALYLDTLGKYSYFYNGEKMALAR